ncbi:hypothetical protein WJX73_005087 [Symbiochloris irregularis]|uniref:SAP domain-containing protein n=1 Tax=Symbiochloris irregularis TaxID=706552 RepID=A0AAW1PRV4_9CHLO
MASSSQARADNDGVPDRAALNKLTIAQLKEKCTDWGLTVSGNKQVLIGRLISSGGAPAERVKGDLRPALPVGAGPWMQRCVKTWKLAPPYNASVSEETWEAYFKERAALDHRYLKQSQPDDSDAEAEDQEAAVPQDEDTEQDAAKQSAAKKPGTLPNKDQLKRNIKSSFYIISYWANWEDDFDSPRTIDCTGRLYAPTGTGGAVDVKFHFHHRMRMSFVESFSHLDAGIRTSFGAITEHGPIRKVFNNEGQDNGTWKRSMMTKIALEEIGEALFGKPRAVSARKVFNLVAFTGGVTCFGDDSDWCFRVMRRRVKLGNGEDSEDRSGDDRDSGNEKSIKKKAEAAKKKRARQNPLGLPFGGKFGGGGFKRRGFGGGFGGMWGLF